MLYGHLLFRLQLMNLLNVNGQPAGGVEASRTHSTFEMLGLLMLHQDYIPLSARSTTMGRAYHTFLVFELPFAIPAPWSDNLQDMVSEGYQNMGAYSHLLILLLCHSGRCTGEDAQKKMALSQERACEFEKGHEK